MLVDGEHGDCFWIKDEEVPGEVLEIFEMLTENERKQNEEAERIEYGKRFYCSGI